MLISFIISTHNRRDVLLDTLERIGDLGLAGSTSEIHVVDNASSDQTAEAVAALPDIHLHKLKKNCGSCAKNVAIPMAKGKFIVFLDDDSYPMPGSIQKMIRHFSQRPRLGAATFTITLPDGSRECSAFPNVFIGCGVGLRREAIDEVGGLPDDFFMQAEEYDLSLRLLDAGWEVESFDDLHANHLKTPVARTKSRTMRLDVRNNLLLIAKYFPSDRAIQFCIDWLWRYWLIAGANRQRRAFLLGMVQGSIRSMFCRRQTVSPQAFEQFARIEQIKNRLIDARHHYRARSILLIDLGKNMLPYRLAAQQCGLRVVGIADNRLVGRRFRGVRIFSDAEACRLGFDIAIVSNSSPVHAAARMRAWQSMDARPIIDLLAPPRAPSITTAA